MHSNFSPKLEAQDFNVKVSNSERLLSCFDNWAKITSDKWVLQTVQGYRINFETNPVQSKLPGKIGFSESEKSLVDQEINKMLHEHAIEYSHHEDGEFISNLFLVPKPNGNFRPVINLKQLNEFVCYEKFKQETLNFVLELIQPNDWFISLDLQSAYWSIPISKEYSKFLKFEWRDQLYTFVCLPFGLSSAPFVFTKVLKPVYASFRSRGIRCSYYIDDSIGMNTDKHLCAKDGETMIALLESLGFVINNEKSIIIPVQRITYFGFILDSVKFMVFLPDKKVEKIKQSASRLLAKSIVPIRELASFIGLLINAFFAIMEAPMHYRNLERQKVQALNASPDYDSMIMLNSDSCNEIKWWLDNVQTKNGKEIRQKPISLWIQSDASNQGYGSYCVQERKRSGGRWSMQEKMYHINVLELLAIFFALKSWAVDKSEIHIAIQSDSMVAIAYINSLGGMQNVKMDSLSKEIWEWCIARKLFLTAFYLPGVENIQADFSSRNFSDTTEWMLKRQIFTRLTTQLVQPTVDLFASRLNSQLQHYVSWTPDPNALCADAFSLDWSTYIPYIFPPFRLMGAILNKINEDSVDQALIVCPYWTNQTWFPMLLHCIICLPVRIPRHRDLLTLPHNGAFHPMGKNLQLIGVIVSGQNSKVKAFQRMLPNISSIAGELGPKNSIPVHGESGVCGVILDKVIHFVQLKK